MHKLHLVLIAFTLTSISAWSDAPAQSRVPLWNARGVGPLPQQGIACVDVGADGTIMVGTISPAGLPNVLALNPAGTLLSQHEVGQRWIGEVAAVAKDNLFALCTTPGGRAEDVPTVYSCGKSTVEIPSQLGQTDYPQTVFHYGDHSNHAGPHVASYGKGAVVLYGQRLLWMEQPGSQPTASAKFQPQGAAVTVSLAVHESGAAVVGCSADLVDSDEPPQNLFAFTSEDPKPIWSRALVADVVDAPSPEKGQYGTPTLPDGKQMELPQRDVPVTAPLSIAVDRAPRLDRIATADYRGWQRWIRSSATDEEQNYGTRFMPARPTISVR